MATEAHVTPAQGLFRGEDKSLVFTIVDENGAAKNISGWTLSWVVKRYPTDADADALLALTTVSGIVLTTPGSGICTVTIADTDWADLVGGTLYHHELKRTDAGFETVLSYGQFLAAQSAHE